MDVIVGVAVGSAQKKPFSQVWPAVQQLKKTAHSLGLSTEALFPAWRDEDPRSPGAIATVFCHLLDLAMAFFGPPQRWHGEALATSGGKADHFVVTLRFARATATLRMSASELSFEEKEEALKIVRSLLKPGGWFINADCMIAETPEIETMYQKLRIDGILSRAKKTEPRFTDFASTRAWLDRLEAEEQDNPIKISQELDIMHRTGFKNIEILWKEYREMVLCGQR